MKNVEIKARCSDPDRIERILLENGADFKGTDVQCDTYFNVPNGRLKLRQGNIENALIYYDRQDKAGPKESDFMLYRADGLEGLLPILEKSLGIMKKVVKTRKIFYIDEVKFHIDHLESLGDFVEIEVCDPDDSKTMEVLESVCNRFMTLFDIKKTDLVEKSYSDLL